MHEWAAVKGLQLKPVKSKIIVISRCRVDIPSPEAADIVFRYQGCLQRRTAVNHFKKEL
jgi:hypothetical protein